MHQRMKRCHRLLRSPGVLCSGLSGLLWLKAFSRLCPRIVGAARGVYLPLGRRLVLAGLQALSPSPRPAWEAIMPVSLAAVGPAFCRVTFDWLRDVWHERGLLSEDPGMRVLGEMKTAGAVTLHVIRTKDASPPEQAAVPSFLERRLDPCRSRQTR